MGEIINRRSTTPPDALVKRICYPRIYSTTSSSIKPCQHGRSMEAEARKEYIILQSSRGYNVKVEERGLVVDQNQSWLGASVDGMVEVLPPHAKDMGLLEIKCPYINAEQVNTAVPSNLIQLIIARNNFYLTLEDVNKIVINTKHYYYSQIQAQLGILQLKWCDLMVYYKVPGTDICDSCICRVQFNSQLFENCMLPKLQEFYVVGVAAEILTRRVEKGQKLYPNSKKYIYRTKENM